MQTNQNGGRIMSQILELADSIFAAMPDNTKKLFIALTIIVCVDYITGVCAAIKEKKLSSKQSDHTVLLLQ